MAAQQLYTQCRMHGLDEVAGYVWTAWIPTRFATVGKVVRIDDLAGRWKVVERGETKGADWVDPKSRDHLHQREASDV